MVITMRNAQNPELLRRQQQMLGDLREARSDIRTLRLETAQTVIEPGTGVAEPQGETGDEAPVQPVQP
ncbi:hypothetical protein AB0I10_32940 [Streptomyces sp. NPDC050636]|uniref:hypothetical protein n=1 Tax=Streptomyces sp. NPDC050636 TaxID=3154510 RepID=UPI00342C241F